MPPPYHRPTSTGMPLGVLALIMTFVCGPVGLVLGIVALYRRPAPGSADRICAILAVAIEGVLLCCTGSYFGISFLSAVVGQ